MLFRSVYAPSTRHLHYLHSAKNYLDKVQTPTPDRNHPEEKILNDAVASSKWAHVQTGEDYYVVGVLFNDDEPSFICYGVPASSKQNPPSELENACVWLPVGDGSGGYWVIYQSAKTGEIVK